MASTTHPSAPRVLVVDDEPLMRWSLAELLAEHGCDVVEAEDGRAASAAVNDRTAPIDVVFLDLRLPDSSDLALLRSIHHDAPESKVVLMTAYATPEIEREAYAEGAFNVLTKPFAMNEVLALVNA